MTRLFYQSEIWSPNLTAGTPKNGWQKGRCFSFSGFILRWTILVFGVQDLSRETYSYSPPWNLSLHDSHKSHFRGNNVNSPWQFLNPIWCGLNWNFLNMGVHNNWSTWTYLIYCDLDFGATKKGIFIPRSTVSTEPATSMLQLARRFELHVEDRETVASKKPSSSHHNTSSEKEETWKNNLFFFFFFLSFQVSNFRGISGYKIHERLVGWVLIQLEEWQPSTSSSCKRGQGPGRCCGPIHGVFSSEILPTLGAVWFLLIVFWLELQGVNLMKMHGTYDIIYFMVYVGFNTPSFLLPSREQHIPQKWYFEDDFPFPQVGYVNFLEGIHSICISSSNTEASCGPSSDSGASLARRESSGDAGQ